MPTTTPRRAIGIVRVSRVNGRDGESFASPAEQRDRIGAECERLDLRLLDTTEEMDVSGGTPLEERHGLRHAVEAVEAGDADVIVAAYFDRSVRSLRVQGELVERVRLPVARCSPSTSVGSRTDRRGSGCLGRCSAP